MVVLGLDQATKVTGWSIFENRKLIAYNKIIIPDKYKAEKRMGLMTEEIRKIILRYEPDKVYFEQTFSKGSPRGFRTLCQLQGFIMWELHMHRIPYAIIEESVWAKNISCCHGEREERKNSVLGKIEEMFNIKLGDSNDISDAIAIGYYGACQEKVD